MQSLDWAGRPVEGAAGAVGGGVRGRRHLHHLVSPFRASWPLQVAFLEAVDSRIGMKHLFKRSIVLVRCWVAWCWAAPGFCAGRYRVTRQLIC